MVNLFSLHFLSLLCATCFCCSGKITGIIIAGVLSAAAGLFSRSSGASDDDDTLPDDDPAPLSPTATADTPGGAPSRDALLTPTASATSHHGVTTFVLHGRI